MRTPDVTIIGGGFGGLVAALAFAEAGCQLTVLERDVAATPASIDAVGDWRRASASQWDHSHVFMPRLRRDLAQRLPDVLDALEQVGVRPLSIAESAFGVPGDAVGADDLKLLPCRRSVFEWVLRRVAADRGIDVRLGVRVVDLVTEDASPPRVVGVQLDDGTRLCSDLVVVATGASPSLVRWLRARDIELDEEVSESPISYATRFYRRRPDATASPFGYILGRRAGVGYAAFEADNGFHSVTLFVDRDDAALRAHIADSHWFDLVCSRFDDLRPIVDDAAVDSATDVRRTGRLVNRLRRLATDDGEPLVTGLLTVGDAYLITNPAYGRGCTTALVQALAAADAFSRHGASVAASTACEEVAASEITPWFHICRMLDQILVSSPAWQDFALGSDGPISTAEDELPLRVAGARLMSMLDPPTALFTNPDLSTLLARPMFGLTRRHDGPALTREELVKGALVDR